MDKNIFMLAIRRFSAVAIVAAGLISCIKDEMPGSRPENGNEGDLRLNIVSQGILDKFEVGTKGTDMKTAQEQEIKSLHVFIFDSLGQYLQASENHRYQGYRNITDGKTVLNIDRNGWAEPEKARNATIVTVANVEDGTFVYDEGTGDKHPSNITGFADFADLVYKPTIPRGITELPSTGMPMFKVESGVDLTSSNTAKSIDIKLKAMMSRIDVSIAVNSQNTDLSGTLPALTITNCEVFNAPSYSTFVENPLASTNVSDSEAPDYVGCHDETWQPDIITIHNNGERLDFTFYVFENLQEKISYTYPPGVEEEDYQRYKPYLADTSKALAFKFSGNYITYNGASYEASYTLYLGANNYDDFKVSRNKQYKNNVTIKGIVNVGNNDEHVTFDARVDITESNPYFISMLRDRTMDSHFNVVPLDVYLFNTGSGVSRSIDVEILDPQTNNWLRLEKVSAAHMFAGSAEDPGTQIETHEAWHAGNGKRKYFTTDLVTNTLKDNTAYYDLGHRDRIYLYVDENLDVWRLNSTDSRTRTATLQLTYKEDGVAKETRTITIEQSKLLEVTFHKNRGETPEPGYPADETNNMGGTTIYIEAYEEYRDYGDPLDEFATEQVYYGLPWEDYSGGSGTEIGSLWFSNGYYDDLIGTTARGSVECYENYYWGLDFTKLIVEESENNMLRDMDLNGKPRTAAGYCYAKNKRNADGSISNPKWYLPGIRELERILEDYYIEYPEFQANYYWSSAAGFDEIGIIISRQEENLRYARATKAHLIENEDGTTSFKYSESGDGYDYTGENGEGGRTPRKQLLRIRAARTDALPQN